MTVTWTAPGGVNTCTLSASATHTTAQIMNDAGAPAGVGSLVLRNDIEIYECRDARIVIGNGSTWEEKTAVGSDVCVWLFHSFNGDDSAVEFGGATATFDWGNKIGTDVLAPVTSKGHGYWFQTYNKSANFHWSRFTTTLGDGIFRFYGGMFQQIETLAYDTGDDGAGGGTPNVPFSITGVSSGATATVGAITVDSGSWAGTDAVGNMSLNRVTGIFTDGETVDVDGDDDSFVMNGDSGSNELYMPNDEVEIMQANFARCGGVKFGPASTVLETKFKLSRSAGFSFSGDNTAQTMNKIQMHRFETALTLTGDGDAIMSNLSLRDVTADLSVTTFTGSLVLVDSTDLSTLDGTLDFDAAVSTNYVRQSNSLNLKVVDSAGADLQNVRVQAYRKDTNELYEADQLTDANGLITEVITSRSQLDADHLTLGTILDYGNVGLRLRDYGRVWHDLDIIPTENAVVLVRTMVDNAFTVDGTGGQYSSDTADAYTGVAFVEGITDAVSLTYNENSPSADTITRGAGSFVTDNWEAGMYIRISGTALNDKVVQIDPDTAVAALTITLIAADDLTAETIISRLHGYQVDLTSGTADTLNKVYSNIQAELEKTANMDLPTFMTTSDGVGYALPDVTQITGMDNIDFEGGFIVQQDGVKRFVAVVLTGVVSGAKCGVYSPVNGGEDIELGSVTSGGTTATVITEYSGSDATVIVRARLQGFIPYAEEHTLIGGGLNIAVNLEPDTVF